jgi:NADH:ubiquinone reductase (H+-translocating)
MSKTPEARPHVVIIGGGFGGLTAAQSLSKAPVRITLIDRTNHHLFQPLLYQVAMAGLSPAEIAMPIRSIVGGQRNVTVLLDEAERIDLDAKTVFLKDGRIGYDFLILATGARTTYFGHDEWAHLAPGLKDLDDAVEIRRRVLLAFEAAEREFDEAERRRLMTFVVIGGGPTGVELAGSLAELARFVLARDFRVVEAESAKVILIEAAPKILAAFGDELSEAGLEQLRELGVEVRTGTMVTDIDERGVHLGEDFVPTATVLWGAGVQTTPITKTLGVEIDRAGRVVVQPDLSVPDHPDAFVIGDAAAFLHQDGKPLPGVSPVAMQQGRAVAESIVRTLRGRPRDKFVYTDKGSMATIGRSRAVALVKGMKLRGHLAWLAWLFVHLIFLIGFRNRIVVLITWAWSYFTYKRGARLITGHRLTPGPPQ